MNGEHKEIYDSLSELKTTTAEMKKDIKYIRGSVEENKEDYDDLLSRVRNNEKKLYMGIGAITILLALIELVPLAINVLE